MTKTPKNNKMKPQIKPPKNDDSIIVCWCDNGNTDGKFTEGLMYTALTSRDVPIASAMRIQGNQIGRQRQVAFDFWMDNTDFPWILWVDSDIELTRDALRLVWNEVDPTTKPVVSGVYFVSKENEQSLMAPYPAIFTWTDDPYKIAYLHPLPKSALVKVGAAGFGFLLMHKNVGAKMREVHGKKPFFNETGVGEQFVSEDINFFRMMADAGVPLFAHTGATVRHFKRFAFDLEYYKLFWSSGEANPKLKA
jgi:hypothetical protein